MALDRATNPYPGPRPFEPDEAHLFFGREWEDRELVSLIFAHRVVFLYAQSGAGKTSFLNAKLVPSLRREGFDVVGPVRIAAPGAALADEQGSDANIFTRNLIAALAPSGSHQLPARTLADFLSARPPVTDEDAAPLPRVLLCDQFEEIFRTYPTRRPDRAGFFAQLAEALRADRLLHVVLVIREDYLGELESAGAELPERPPLRFRLERLNADAALQAVVKPTVSSGRWFAPHVAEALVERLVSSPGEGEFVEPVQLQVVCRSLWRDLPRDVEEISRDHLKRFGDVNETLASFYEECLQRTARATGVGDGVLRSWFEHTLITADRTRGTAFRGPAETAGVRNDAVDDLENQHLIRPEVRANGRWYELTHDRFIEPILLSNHRWRERRPDTERIRAWLEERASRVPLAMLDPSELRQADEWRAQLGAADLQPSPGVQALMQASRNELQRLEDGRRHLEEQAASARKLRWLAAGLACMLLFTMALAVWALRERAAKAQALADREQALKEISALSEDRGTLLKREQETSKKLDLAWRAAKAAQADAESHKTIAEAQANIARQQQKRAELATVAATKAQADAVELAAKEKLSREREKLEREKAEAATRRAEDESKKNLRAERLASAAALSDRALSKLSSSPAEAFQDAAKAVRDLHQDGIATRKTLEALAAVLPAAMFRQGFAEHDLGQLTDLTFDESADGIVMLGARGTVVQRDLVSRATQQGVATTASSHPHADSNPDSVALAPSGDLVVTASILPGSAMARIFKAGGTLHVSDLHSQRVSDYQTHRHPLTTMVVSPDSRLIASGSNFGFRFLHDLTTGRRLWRRPGRFSWLKIMLFGTPPRVATAMAFSRDGSRIAVGIQDGSVEVRDLEGRLIWQAQAHTEPVLGLTFNHDGSELVTTGRDRLAKLWQLPHSSPLSRLEGSSVVPQTPLRTLDPHGDAVLAARFGRSDAVLATGAQDGIVRLWDPGSGVLLAALPPMTGYVRALAFDGAGVRLAVGSSDGSVRLWDLTRLQNVRMLQEELRAIDVPDTVSLADIPSERMRRILELIALLEGETHAGRAVVPE